MCSLTQLQQYLPLSKIVPVLFCKLLDHETKAANQIPLLMKIERYDAALKKAIDSGDSNLSK